MNKARPLRRYASITGLRPEKAAYYEALHAKPWPGVLRKIRACHIRNYSIHVKKIGRKLYLFSFFEYIGRDYEVDMKKMAADPETRRWWKETAPCQIPLPDAPKGGTWAPMREVFYNK